MCPATAQVKDNPSDLNADIVSLQIILAEFLQAHQLYLRPKRPRKQLHNKLLYLQGLLTEFMTSIKLDSLGFLLRRYMERAHWLAIDQLIEDTANNYCRDFKKIASLCVPVELRKNLSGDQQSKIIKPRPLQSSKLIQWQKWPRISLVFFLVGGAILGLIYLFNSNFGLLPLLAADLIVIKWAAIAGLFVTAANLLVILIIQHLTAHSSAEIKITDLTAIPSPRSPADTVYTPHFRSSPNEPTMLGVISPKVSSPTARGNGSPQRLFTPRPEGSPWRVVAPGNIAKTTSLRPSGP